MNNSSSNDSQYAQKRFGSSYYNSNSHLNDTQAIDQPKSSFSTILIKVENNNKKEEEKEDEINDDKEDKKKKEKDLRIIDHIHYFPDEKKDRIILEKTKMEKNYIEIDSNGNNHKNLISQDLKFNKNENNSESIDSIEEVEYDSDSYSYSDNDNWINDESTKKDINFIYSEIKDLIKSIKNIKFYFKNLFSNTYFRFPIGKEKTLPHTSEYKQLKQFL